MSYEITVTKNKITVTGIFGNRYYFETAPSLATYSSLPVTKI